MPAACRIGDPISCGDTECQGSPNVFANGIPWTRVDPDLTCGHCFNPTPIASGSPNVFINGFMVARVGDPIVPHTCPPVTHGGNVAAGSPDVFANNASGGGAMIDGNPPYTTAPDAFPQPPVGVQPSPPPGVLVTSGQVAAFEDDDADASPQVTTFPPQTGPTETEEIMDDQTPPPPNPPPTQDCSTVDALPASFTWTSVAGSFSTWASSFALSPNFTVADMTINCAVSSYAFTTSATQPSGLTQKQILLNMCHHAKTVLEPMLTRYGPFTITSGWRNKTNGSQHNKGQATDIQFLGFHGASNTGAQYYARAQDLRDNINYDQFILEWFANNPWFHVSSNPSSHRNNVLTQVGRGSYAPGLKQLRP